MTDLAFKITLALGALTAGTATGLAITWILA